MKVIKYLLLFIIKVICSNSFAQIPTCTPTGNLLIFSNYDGGELNINIDQNIPNLKIGVCTYEPVRITISGPFASNVSQVLYAGFNSVQNNNNCNIGNFPTSIIGVPLSNQSILTVPPVTLNNPNGSNIGIVCGYSCDVNTNQGGCNTIDQIEDYFITQLGGTLYSLNAQYCCWLDSYTFQVSQLAGSCCNSSIGSLTLTSAFNTDSQTVCINNPITNITYSYNNATPTVSGLPNGVNYTINNGVVTISGTPTTVGSFNYTLSIPGNCGNVQTTSGTIIVNTFIEATIVASVCSTYTAPWGTVYTQSGTYTDTLTTLNGCDSIVSVNLTITGAIIAPSLTASACSTYTAPWGTVYTQSGTYTDTLTTMNGCDSIVSVNLTITGLPIVTAESVSASCELPNGTATANATGGSGNYSYSWSNGATGSFITGLASGSYSVIATDQNGCASSIQVTVLCDSTIAICELSTPNAFTPDGDGINDKFCPLTNCTLEDYEFSIYNRWGELIFKTSNQKDKWDGKFKGSACSVGVYVYAITYKFPSQQTKNAYGNITLLR